MRCKSTKNLKLLTKFFFSELKIYESVSFKLREVERNGFLQIMADTPGTGNRRIHCAVPQHSPELWYIQNTSNLRNGGIQTAGHSAGRFLKPDLRDYSNISSLFRVTQTRSILPPRGGFNFEIFTSASVTSGKRACTACRIR